MKRVLIAGNIGQRRVEIPAAYLRALRAAEAAGAVAFADTPEDAAAYASLFDALLLPGGGDLPGEHFGQATHPACELDDPTRDLSDKLLMEAFMARGKRVLGICRGCQVANVFLGGSLHQHLPDAFSPVLWHSGNITGRHPASVEAGTLLASLLGAGEIRVNSSHHQAIDRVGRGLRVAAQSPDGVVEAAEGKNILLLQWHPEQMADTMRGIFEWLIG
ncbi:MAG: gamma-glutamyl-gamma-aminobutyrate hydrolase family protein [Firmicutes bacterium]|nr:gamma-glutamyl-gamma-aminobutyrate hydrolase family protein [Bacillota bacterium]